ncbi:unnamed protein product [Cyprideis torosa]|uniref:Uncharacterized protein n=1 Tax=Cyprideis torosa TaxID=163714 RepID=A0A7R8ZMV3_9CRUS|nr:unnamed protein product [Cyprideis torosa]CAG0885226.1 unnamed protein product [Cyprideis torosa]
MPRAGGDPNRPRGKMTAYACFVKVCRDEHKKKHPDETVVFQEFSRKCAERWKTMSEAEKKRFKDMADEDSKRYDHEMQYYVPPPQFATDMKKKKKKKDPTAPKRALSAFFWYCADRRADVKKDNPDWTVGQIARELGKEWANVTPEVKGKYEAMAQKDKARYDRDMEAYRGGGGAAGGGGAYGGREWCSHSRADSGMLAPCVTGLSKKIAHRSEKQPIFVKGSN